MKSKKMHLLLTWKSTVILPSGVKWVNWVLAVKKNIDRLFKKLAKHIQKLGVDGIDGKKYSEVYYLQY